MKKSKKKLIILITLLLVIIISVIIAVISCSRDSDDSSAASGNDGILVEPLQKHDLSQSISASGTIESQTTISVTSDLNCKISQLNVQVGDYVNQGDVLCVFDTSDIQAQIHVLEQQQNESNTLENKQNAIRSRSLQEAKEDQQRQLKEAQAAIDSAQTSYNDAIAAKSNLDAAYQSCQTQITDIQNSMNTILQTEGQTDTYFELESRLSELTISANDLLAQVNEAKQNIGTCQNSVDTAKTDYENTLRTTNRQIQECQDSIDTQGGTSAEANNTAKELEELRRKLDKTTVIAEHSGLITALNVTEGSIHSGGALMTIQDTNALKLTVSIKETDILNIKEGMRAIITTNATEDFQLEGTITKVVNFVGASSGATPAGDDSSGSSGGYSAEITLDGNPNLLLGMTAKAKILISDEEETLAVGYDSIMEDENGSYVYRAVPAKKDGRYKIERVPVILGTDSDYYTAITSDDLAEGDYIIIFPDEVNEGDIVRVDESFLDGMPSDEKVDSSDVSESVELF